MIVLILVILILAAAEVGMTFSGLGARLARDEAFRGIAERYCAAMQLVIWRGRIREELRTV